LSDWNRGFDEDMNAFQLPERRGKAVKITLEMVRKIVQVAEDLRRKGKRLRIKGFTEKLRKDHDICLSKRKVQEILVANNLFATRTRKRRPGFYQSLRKRIPNGLLSLDGSELTVWIDEEAYKFNVELSVDVKTFAHTAFGIGDTETCNEVIKVLEAHRKNWGVPLGVLCDHGSGNLGAKTRDYCRMHQIELVPVGPGNPKGNGTDEGAFSQMKQVLGFIRLDTSSPKALARSVLEKLISLYVTMRNRIFTKGKTLTPGEEMGNPVSTVQKSLERDKIKEHIASRKKSQHDQDKTDHLHQLIQYYDIMVETGTLKRAEKTIKAYEEKAISAAEEAFIKAVNRKPERKNLAYFFGILKRVQQERDDEAYKHYCYQLYNEKVMAQLKKDGQNSEYICSVEDVIGMLVQAVKSTVRFVKDLAIKKARQWTAELLESYRYTGPLKKQFGKALEGITDLNLDQKNEVWNMIEQLLNPKTKVESVTRFS